MKTVSIIRNVVLISVLAGLSGIVGCAPSMKLVADYQERKPKVIVLLPPENTTANNDIEYKVYPALFQYLARRGYYVISPEMVRSILIANKLEDAGRVNSIPVQKIGEVFNADAVMRCKVTEWSKVYIIISTSINVGYNLELFEAKTGESLWQYTRTLSKSPNNSNSSIIATLITNAIAAAVEQYEPVADQNAAEMLKTIPKGDSYGKW